MKHPDNTTTTTFDDLFSRLLSTRAEEDDIKAKGGTPKALVEVRARLQALRSDLAAVRNRLVTEATTRLSDHQPPRYAI
jgi:hypothetical protein